MLSIFHLLIPVEVMLPNLLLRHLCKGASLKVPSKKITTTESIKEYCCLKWMREDMWPVSIIHSLAGGRLFLRNDL